MLVNFIRSEVHRFQEENGGEVTSNFVLDLQQRICANPVQEFLTEERYMRPFQPNGNNDEDMSPDPLLYLLSEALSVSLDDNNNNNSNNNNNNENGTNKSMENQNQVEVMTLELARYKTLLANMAASSMGEDSTSITNSNANKINNKVVSAGAGAGDINDNNDKDKKPNDDYYFDGYSSLTIHEIMLRDSPRTTTYGAAMLENKDFFKGKIVLDVGCGTGILCMYAAKAGAKKVIGVDLSSIIERSKRIINKNGYSDIITLVKGRLEEVTLPLNEDKNEKVDIIISEWMGYALYYENMLSSVIYARDKWLNPNKGCIMPSNATIYIDAMTANNDDDRLGFWYNVYGFNMSDVTDLFVKEAQVQYVNNDQCIGKKCSIHTLNIMTANDSDLDFKVPFTIEINTTISSIKNSKNENENENESGNDIAHILKGFVLSFDVLFGQCNLKSENENENENFIEKILSTHSSESPTHWKQTALWLNKEDWLKIPLNSGNNGIVTIDGTIEYTRCEDNKRDYDIILTWKHPTWGTESSIGKVGKVGKEYIQRFILGS